VPQSTRASLSTVRTVFRSLKPYKMADINIIDNLLILSYTTSSHFLLGVCSPPPALYSSCQNARSLSVQQPCRPTDNLRSVVCLVDTSSTEQDGWLPTLPTSFHLLLPVSPRFPPTLSLSLSPSSCTDNCFLYPPCYYYSLLTPLFGLLSQATPCILGRKRRTTTITQSRRMSTRSRAAVNTTDIEPLALVTASCVW